MSERSELSRRERKKRDCKYAILRVAKELMKTRGLDVPIEEIADGADISYPTFFNYFPNKASLYYAIYLEEVEDIREFVDIELRDEPSAARRIERIFDTLMQDFSRYPYMDLYIAGEVARRTAEAGEEEQIALLLIDAIMAGQHSGEFRPGNEARYYVLLMTGILFSSSLYGCGRDDCRRMLDILLDSMRETNHI